MTRSRAAHSGSVVVYPDPTMLHRPVRVIEGEEFPYGVAFNSHGEMYVTESSLDCGQVAVLDSSGKRISTIGSRGDGPGWFQDPYYIAIDSNDNVYVPVNTNCRSLTGMASLSRVLRVAVREANLESSTCPEGSKFIRTKCKCVTSTTIEFNYLT